MPSQHGLVKISGSDAKKLLQGQLTCNVDDVTTTNSCLGAHCNPQGRIMSLFRLFLYHDAYYLYLSKRLVPVALSALKKYAAFYKVELTDASDELEHIQSIIHLEPYADLQKGIAALYPETSGKFLPHDLNLPELQAVSFTKGCFTGQEIIARMQYRGKPKNHLFIAEIESQIAPQPGDDIYSDTDRVSGTLADVAHMNNNMYQVLLVTDILNAKDNHLFLKPAPTSFLKMITKETRK